MEATEVWLLSARLCRLEAWWCTEAIIICTTQTSEQAAAQSLQKLHLPERS